MTPRHGAAAACGAACYGLRPLCPLVYVCVGGLVRLGSWAQLSPQPLAAAGGQLWASSFPRLRAAASTAGRQAAPASTSSILRRSAPHRRASAGPLVAASCRAQASAQAPPRVAGGLELLLRHRPRDGSAPAADPARVARRWPSGRPPPAVELLSHRQPRRQSVRPSPSCSPAAALLPRRRPHGPKLKVR